ncbi:hypothetical protein ACJX0J_017017, partial [Zea mays]
TTHPQDNFGYAPGLAFHLSFDEISQKNCAIFLLVTHIYIIPISSSIIRRGGRLYLAFDNLCFRPFLSGYYVLVLIHPSSHRSQHCQSSCHHHTCQLQKEMIFFF